MKLADLYIRVSTDEQADKGYSQRDQEERLRKYCEINSIQVRKVVFEDHSAKTFNRPEWQKLLSEYKKRKVKTDLVLFTKWDRFSRNAGDAYQMISTLRQYGIEPQAVEQPLDMSIPENKMMMAFYLAAPEVENDRRALNTFYGMRRAKKEGRWMASAPVGYINKVSEDGKKYIAVHEKNAGILRWAFNEIAYGTLAADQVRKEANKKGLKCSRSNFWSIIRNPVYCGKIFIPKYKEEEAHLVQGQHEPIISENLFYMVQDVLDGNKRKERPNTKIASDENLPLRGYLVCPKCDRMITGSASKGKYSLYYYYHCISSCGFRQRADNANDLFVEELRKFKPHPAVVDLSKAIITQAYQYQFRQKQNNSKQVVEEINKLNAKLSKARDLLLTEAIDAGDYKEIKAECESKLARLEGQLAEKSSTTSVASIERSLDKAIQTLTRIDVMYENGTVTDKRAIISSIFPEKITFDGSQYRTPRLNSVVRYIYQINNNLHQIKNWKSEDFFHLSGLVAPSRIELLSNV
ncbi:recombinase family protein [Parapedobacter sp. SGR-10]|uniref:recombinase family protein n=1 Tax=Parapedobacter sp. SGR-10 TaxID=2710879 RepID=UPI0013D899F7|nr:recombinase family protein [Parapedobacter sp. SGR-10]NGF55583.1 recombinase family protein [Parapedobacter sp. SGR-10]